MMTSAQVVEMQYHLSPSEDYTHPDEHNLAAYDIYFNSCLFKEEA